MSEKYLIAQAVTTSDWWTLYIDGQAVYRSDLLEGVFSWMRMHPVHAFPAAVPVMLRPLADSATPGDEHGD